MTCRFSRLQSIFAHLSVFSIEYHSEEQDNRIWKLLNNIVKDDKQEFDGASIGHIVKHFADITGVRGPAEEDIYPKEGIALAQMARMPKANNQITSCVCSLTGRFRIWR